MKGFTLMELLVTVLIISILAAIALPGLYNLVQLSRIKAQFGLFDSLLKAQAMHRLSAGEMTSYLQNLDITIEAEVAEDKEDFTRYKAPWGNFGLYKDYAENNYIAAEFTNGPVIIFYERPNSQDGATFKAVCVAEKERQNSHKICRRAGPLLQGYPDGVEIYAVQ